MLRLPNIIFQFEFLRSMVFTTALVSLIGDKNLRRKEVTALLGAICSKTYPSFLTLRKAPPLISVFSPQGRRGKPPYSVLGTATLLGWRTIRGLRQVLRAETARKRFAIRTHFALITRLMRLPTKNVTMRTGVG